MKYLSLIKLETRHILVHYFQVDQNILFKKLINTRNNKNELFSFSIMLTNNKNVKEIPAFSIASFISDSPYQAVYGLSNPVQFGCEQ